MLLSRVKKLCQKGASFAIKALPVIVPAFLLFHTNSTCCIVNGQPTPPNSTKFSCTVMFKMTAGSLRF